MNFNQDQFIELFRKNHRFLYMIAMRYVQDQDVANDLVQDFFINYWEKRQDSVKVSFEAYASRSIKNRCISYLRSKQTDNKRIDKFGAETYTEVDDEERARDLDTLRFLVFKAIDQLPPERKKIMLLNGKEGLSNQQIADQLGISTHTVKSQLVKGYAFIRQQVKHEHQSSSDNFDAILSVVILSALFTIV